MTKPRKVSLFRNGANQAVRIPKDFELSGTEALLRREGNLLILEPISKVGLLAVLSDLSPLTETLPEIEDPHAEPVDL
jgi:antitoxin VapB